MAILKSHHLELLQHLAAQRGSVPISDVDGRNLRPLRANGFIAEHGHSIVLTPAGRRHAEAERSSTHRFGSRPATPAPLSGAQEEVLRTLLRAPGAVLADHIDGRVLRALEARDLIRREGDWISASEKASDHFDQHVRRARKLRTRRASSPARGNARAEALLRAIEQLEAAIPRGAELSIGDMPAYADDVLAGLRRFAKGFETRTHH